MLGWPEHGCLLQQVTGRAGTYVAWRSIHPDVVDAPETVLALDRPYP